MPILNWIAVGGAIVLTAIVTLFSHDIPHEPKPLPAMPTLGAIPNTVSIPAIYNPLVASLGITATTAATAPTTTLNLGQTVLVPKKPAAAPSTPATSAPTLSPAASSTPITTPEAPSPSTTALSTSIGLARGALVNIICVPKGGPLRSASASGVVIDSRGVILTVAHMAQYFLLTDYPNPGSVTCVIRTGSPATNAYRASLAYISPDWIKANGTTLTEDAPTGSGENDFALLVITGSIGGQPLPASFAAIPLASDTPKKGDAVTIASYGAEFLTGPEIRSALYPIVVFGSVGDRFTFHSTSVDLISIDRTAAAQEGSSGGGVINASNQVTGLITTSSSGAIASRDLHAITPLHIRTSFADDMHESLDSYIASRTPSELVSDFAAEAHTLGQKLGKEVE